MQGYELPDPALDLTLKVMRRNSSLIFMFNWEPMQGIMGARCALRRVLVSTVAWLHFDVKYDKALLQRHINKASEEPRQRNDDIQNGLFKSINWQSKTDSQTVFELE